MYNSEKWHTSVPIAYVDYAVISYAVSVLMFQNLFSYFCE